MIKAQLWLPWLVWLAACSSLSSPEPAARPDPLIGQIYQSGSLREPGQVMSQATQTDLIFLGETHDNLRHHQIQAQVIQHLVAQGKKPTLAFELFEANQTAELMAYTTAHPKDPQAAEAKLRKRLGWEKQDQWAGYHDLLLLARQEGLDVAAMDLPSALKRRLTKKNLAELSSAERAQLPNYHSPSEAYRLAMFDAFTEGHCGWSDPQLMAGLYRVWLARNQAMADQLALLLDAGGPVVVILGNGHQQWGLGVPERIGQMRPQARQFQLAIMEVDIKPRPLAEYFEHTHSAGVDLGPSFEWLWFTDRHSWVDPCQRFKESLSRHPQKK
ncbi:MAG: ChaN family lipoprotein [bacterium]|nr:ChaN family lipoprotein [bacterium]